MRSSFRPRRLRVAQLTIAATMLVLPASAFAFAGNTATDAQGHGALPIRVAPAHVQAGRPVRITGTTPQAQAGERVILQGRIAGRSHWRSLQTTMVGAAGRFQFTAHLRRSGLVRVITSPDARPLSSSASGAASGAASLAVGSSAAAKPITVTADIVARRSDRAVLAGGRVTVRGHVLPAAGVRRVRLQGHSGHGWQTLATARTGGSGRYSLGYHATTGTNRDAPGAVRR